MTSSPGIEELNLDHNLIGDGGARELLQGLMLRKEAGFPVMKLWVTVYISQETFQKIVEYSSTGKKKKGGKGKKKVGIIRCQYKDRLFSIVGGEEEKGKRHIS